MITTIKQLQPVVAKSLMATYCLVATASPIQGVAAAPMTLQEALDDMNPPTPPIAEPPIPEGPSLTANEQALLETIALAEGTWDKSTQTIVYDMRFGDRPNSGSLNIELPHPQQVRGSRYGSGYRSDAAGAFQFLSTTWKGLHHGNNPAMTPTNQDAAALQLVQSTGYDINKPFRHQAYLLAGTWASIPTRSGWSYYNQPVKGLTMLSRFYNQRIAAYETVAKVELLPSMCDAFRPAELTAVA